MSETQTPDERRRARLAEIEARAAEDRAQAAGDAALDLPLLDDFLGVVGDALAAAEARMAEIDGQLIRKTSTRINQSLTTQIRTLGQLRGNLKVIAEAMKAEAEAIVAAPAPETGA